MNAYRTETGELVVQVRATRLGYYSGRKKPGQVFAMRAVDMKQSTGVDGKGIVWLFPSWVCDADDESQAGLIETEPDRDARRFAAAAIAASGSVGAARRRNSFNNVMAGESRDTYVTPEPTMQQGVPVDLPVPHKST